MQKSDRSQADQPHEEVPKLKIHHISGSWDLLTGCDIYWWEARNSLPPNCGSQASCPGEELDEEWTLCSHGKWIPRHFIPRSPTGDRPLWSWRRIRLLCPHPRRGRQPPWGVRPASVIAVPRVLLAALDTHMLVFALISKSTTQRAVEKWTPTRATVLERSNFLPLICWNTRIASWLG